MPNTEKQILLSQLRRHLLAVGLGLSILIHFLFIAASLTLPQFQTKKNAPVSIEILAPQNLKNKDRSPRQQIVREAQTPEKLKIDESTDPLKFLSHQTQRVQKQTRAAQSGLTQNRSADQKEQTNPTKTNQDKNQAKKEINNDKGELIYPQKKSKKILEAFAPQYKKTPSVSADRKLDRGVSTIGEALPREVEVGSFTALNTDRYLYYSFFSRIEELIRFNWEHMIRQHIDTTPPDRFKTNVSGVWNTQLEIWLKPNGEFHSAHLLKESGFRGFDQAAVQSFAQARLFPNPPKEMVEEDGLIHLKYYFQVHYEPKVLVNNN